MQYFPESMHLKKLPMRSCIIICSKSTWGPLTKNLTEIRLRGFLHQSTAVPKNQPEISKKLPMRSCIIIYSKSTWGPLTKNLTEIRLRGFLYQGTAVPKNQPEVFKKATHDVLHYYML